MFNAFWDAMPLMRFRIKTFTCNACTALQDVKLNARMHDKFTPVGHKSWHA